MKPEAAAGKPDPCESVNTPYRILETAKAGPDKKGWRGPGSPRRSLLRMQSLHTLDQRADVFRQLAVNKRILTFQQGLIPEPHRMSTEIRKIRWA